MRKILMGAHKALGSAGDRLWDAAEWCLLTVRRMERKNEEKAAREADAYRQVRETESRL